MNKLLALLMISTITGCALPPAYETRRAQPMSDSFTSTRAVHEVYTCVFHGWAVTEGTRRQVESAPLPNGQIVYVDAGTSAAEITATQGGTFVKVFARDWYRDQLVSIARKCK